MDGIDPSIFTDDDGKRYLVTNIGAQITPLSDAGDLLGEPRMIWYGWNRIKSEGPHLLKKDGWYYLFIAEGGTGFGHVESCARSPAVCTGLTKAARSTPSWANGMKKPISAGAVTANRCNCRKAAGLLCICAAGGWRKKR